ncbi:MAG TPA: ATP-binding protein [Actinocrinis sp.]|jgi:anti-sigma regulatory factor (Ser/Thr protein kinase)|uniref:ATP-binding protein n=1 Tax=Actinocrinis sp. TaxID=1920516 RepID=UPI002DDCCCA3|nr:ATP-binding protein [Actinocrinis sp.]HEV3172353.1 ATP-binding protein [Actinocrinis sp.]
MTRSARHPASGPYAAFAGGPSAESVPAHERRLVRQCELIADPGAAKLAREFTRATLPDWGHGELLSDITLVVSELVTNAVRHGVPHAPHDIGDLTIRFGLIRQATFVLCMVHDGGGTPPTVRHVTEPAQSDPLGEVGRGLGIVAQLATTWGWTPPDHNGKTVWATFVTADLHGGTGEFVAPALPHRDQSPEFETLVWSLLSV